MTTITANIGHLRTARAAIRSHVPGGTAKKNQASRTIALTPEAITHTGPLDVPEAIHVTVPLHGTGDATEPMYVDATEFSKAVSVVAGRSNKKNNGVDMHIELIDNTVRFTAPDITDRTATIPTSDAHHGNTLDTKSVDDTPVIEANAGELAHVWDTTHKSLGVDQTLPMLTMFHVGVIGQQVTFAATDRYRMSVAQPKIATTTLTKDDRFLLPTSLMKATTHLDDDASVTISANDHRTTFVLDSDDGTRVIARIDYSNPINPKSLYDIVTGKSHESPTENPVSATLDTDDITSFVKELVKTNSRGRIILHPNTSTIDAEVRGNYDIEKIYAEDSLGLDWDEDVDGSAGSSVQLNNGYLLDTLTMLSTDKVKVVIRSGKAPVLIHEVDGKTRHVVMPIYM